jgi:hypothetical protein
MYRYTIKDIQTQNSTEYITGHFNFMGKIYKHKQKNKQILLVKLPLHDQGSENQGRVTFNLPVNSLIGHKNKILLKLPFHTKKSKYLIKWTPNMAK